VQRNDDREETPEEAAGAILDAEQAHDLHVLKTLVEQFLSK
jgi:hypothetical protein